MEKGKKNPHYGQNSKGCTGTGSDLFFCFDQSSYFCHNFLIYDPILAIQVSD